MKPEIEQFAKALLEHVRDDAIRGSDRALLPSARHALAKRWAKAASELSAMDFARVLIPDVVDEAIFYLLHAIDEGSLKLKYVARDGTDTDLTEQGLGELAGWFVGSESWREAYSKERFVDYSGPIVDDNA